MYTLTLTAAERKAFDFVGGRYDHGDKLAGLIQEGAIDDTEWEDPVDITFHLPEHVAWEMYSIIEETMPQGFACFSDDLSLKLVDFAQSIV